MPSCEPPRALRKNNTILGKQPPHMIDKGGSSADDSVAHAMERLQVLLFDRLDKDEAHGRTHGCLVSSFGVRRVVLRSFDERLHEAWVDQMY